VTFINPPMAAPVEWVKPPVRMPKLFGRLRHGTGEDLRKDVINAPTNYNRAARREVGIFGRLWAWDAKALGVNPNLPPRYVRRHFTDTVLTHPKNRRERKVRARILREMA
jgi:hypothetical protein